MSRFVRNTDFDSLSIKDLLELREAYHIHLANLENVVGTAIGLYRIRKSDSDSKEFARPTQRKANKEPRTLQDSVVMPWSYPCILVFVNKWVPWRSRSQDPDQVIPFRLYLPDGRVAPTCIIEAPRSLSAPPPITELRFPEGLAGGGYLVLTDEQEQERLGTVGCLVTDGHTVFALTNRHVVGEPGTEIDTLFQGERQRIGVAHSKSIGKKKFSEAYPGWPGERTYCNIDAGLIKLDDLQQWTSQVFGVGKIGDPVDLNVDTLNFDLIGTPVRAFGAASGRLEGEIQGLFYRYHSIGGYNYTADLLIGPRGDKKGVQSIPGDSGTVWFWDAENDKHYTDGNKNTSPAKTNNSTDSTSHRPIAVQWGGHTFIGQDSEESTPYVLASSLSTVCRLLDVEILRDWDIGHNEYWGKVGHYKIGAKACELVKNAKLKKLLKKNLTRISVTDKNIKEGKLPHASLDEFVPLADVPDLVWRSKRQMDGPSHFANMDQEGEGIYTGKSLLQLWEDDPDTLNPKKWKDFYDKLGITKVRYQGTLPFRIWHIYDEMVQTLKRKDIPQFICAAGVLAHYVADASQPLHISFLHHGRPDKPNESKVHQYIDTKLLDRFSVELVDGINRSLKGKKTKKFVKGGKAAADAIIGMSKNALDVLSPIEIIETFNEAPKRNKTRYLWEHLNKKLISCMAEASIKLAELWESAWIEGNGDKIAHNKLVSVKEAALMKLYLDRDFLQSKWLRDM